MTQKMLPLYDLEEETKQRDIGIKRAALASREAVRIAHDIAMELVRANGRVTSPEVLREFGKRHPDELPAERRFMGAVFSAKTWLPLGWETTGSHRRPVRIWRLAQDS